MNTRVELFPATREMPWIYGASLRFFLKSCLALFLLNLFNFPKALLHGVLPFRCSIIYPFRGFNMQQLSLSSLPTYSAHCLFRECPPGYYKCSGDAKAKMESMMAQGSAGLNVMKAFGRSSAFNSAMSGLLGSFSGSAPAPSGPEIVV